MADAAPPIRVLIAKPGLDGHDRGAKVVTRALRDAGFEVIYTGRHRSVEEIAMTAVEEDVDVVGLSVLSGAHLDYCTRLARQLESAGSADISLLVGGVIPEADVNELEGLGYAVFGTGSHLDNIIEFIGRGRRTSRRRHSADEPLPEGVRKTMDSPQATAKATPLVDELPGLVGRTLGSSKWVTMTQSAINLFADATHDHQWIHTDPAAAEKGPFGRTIAHGFFTLSLSPWLLGQVLEVTNATSVVNYGLNKVRFPAPVPSGSRIRLTVALNDASPVEGGIQAALGMTFEIEGSERPGCVAEMVVRYLA